MCIILLPNYVGKGFLPLSMNEIVNSEGGFYCFLNLIVLFCDMEISFSMFDYQQH